MPGRRLGKCRHRPVVRRHDGLDALPGEVVQHRLRKRRALLRVGARAKLVEQHERPRRRVIKYLDDVQHVRAERGHRSRDALLVSNVRIHPVEYGKRCSPPPPGTKSPDWCISASSPTVFIATVLPPVFGPVMTSTDDSASMPTDTGMASSPRSGCRASTSRITSGAYRYRSPHQPERRSAGRCTSPAP